jgi:hypothetical protein
MKSKHEAIIIRNRGGKLLEVRLIPHGRQGKTAFVTDKGVAGSMETRTLPESCSDLIEWLDEQGKISQVEQMILAMFR